jgi:hypothetical protein
VKILTKPEKVKIVLQHLNEVETRCTYGALGGYLEIPANFVSNFLGPKRPEASWIVRKDNHVPTGYSEKQKHPNLENSPYVIETTSELEISLAQAAIEAGS